MVKTHEANQQVVNELLGTVRQRQRGGLATGLDTARLEAQLAAERQQDHRPAIILNMELNAARDNLARSTGSLQTLN